MSRIKIDHISKKFKDYMALDDVNLDILSNEFVAFLGPSGSGKTTLLRIIAGLEFPTSGSIFFDDKEVQNEHVSLRNVGFVFQHYALFKHMTVKENVAFGLRVRQKAQRLTDEEIDAKVMELLTLIHMDHLATRYPDELSGGQRQRVALARVLAIKPKLLLLDEPFGALDAKVRKELRRWIRQLHDEIGLTSIFVTHDQEEAMEVADRIVVINQGKIEQAGTPEDVYNHPANSFVYDFLGNYNEFTGWRDPSGSLHCVLPAGVGVSEWEKVKLYVRPYDIALEKTAPAAESLPMQVVQITPAGALAKIELEDPAHPAVVYVEVICDFCDSLSLAKGDRVYITPKKMRAF